MSRQLWIAKPRATRESVCTSGPTLAYYQMLCAANGAVMEFLYEYAEPISDFLTWASSPDASIPVVKLLQGLAATVGALISALGFYKAWRFAESRLGKRLTEFLDIEEQKLVEARQVVRDFRNQRSAVSPTATKLFTSPELGKALKHLRKRRWAKAKTILDNTVEKTRSREKIARKKASLHEKQTAMAYLLLGAIADSDGDHQSALAHFYSALEIDPQDAEALEYLGLQLMKLGEPRQAIEQFERLASIAENRKDGLLHSHALRNQGLAYEKFLPEPKFWNANIAYRDAIDVFPEDGSRYDLAYIHELRGLANMQLRNNSPLAHRSLMNALAIYSRLEHSNSPDSANATKGAKRIHDLMKDLENIQNGGPQEPEGADVNSTPRMLPAPTSPTNNSSSPDQSRQQQPDAEGAH